MENNTEKCIHIYLSLFRYRGDEHDVFEEQRRATDRAYIYNFKKNDHSSDTGVLGMIF